MLILRGASLAVALLIELALLAALAIVAARLEAPVAVRVLVAIALPAAVLVVWGAFFAPRAARRLDPGPRLVLECVLFGLGAVALAVSGLPAVAVVFAVIVAASLGGRIALRQF
ncbi:YrdB family protein [uncultured Amnibacterium sp.]|uniref:YrdB family protein n=1 Tax=uncultured Amnibacterium sp. TaxID=1631851 RepID=UPI0035CC91A0